ncbi:hypothetical protein ACIBIZ_19690 [Nonomuraea spiralis]|uniref:hypothetical protein n=1 Tax=Nonomuraea TaxID=83681 RepID=UPI000F79D2BE|nr:hypothetical protein [Nonomuraea sp. WAC 01424]RSM95302.1 hypothetical protein DMB42_50235 [Nonomuraea sp. WAC 01424]
MAKTYINTAVIPSLCRKAGVPTADVRGSRPCWTARPPSRLLYLAGVVVMAGVFVLVALPLLLALARWGLAGLSTGAIGTAAFWEALAVAAYAVTQLALPPLLALRERRLRRSGRLL